MHRRRDYAIHYRALATTTTNTKAATAEQNIKNELKKKLKEKRRYRLL